MNYIIFGAGQTGINAMHFFDYFRVECFAANSEHAPIEGKEVVSYSKMLNMVKTGDFIIVVASARYNAEMVAQLEADGVKKYFIFHDAAPAEISQVYPSYRLCRQNIIVPYVKVLSMMGISKYQRIVIYGDNYWLPYLISEVAFQNRFDNIVGIVKTSNTKDIKTLGIPVISIDDVSENIDCLIVNQRRCDIKDLDYLEKKQKNTNVCEIYNIEPYVLEFKHLELLQYKDKYKGQRCFVIGNGPSLRIEDLEVLHDNNEICFAANNVYKVYDRTKWRANYIGMVDYRVIEGNRNNIDSIEGIVFLSDEHERWIGTRFKNVQYYHRMDEEYYPNYPRIINDLTIGAVKGYTVTFDIGIQFAIYMGFKEIYLIGVDHSFRGNEDDESNHFIKDYFDENDKKYIKDNLLDITRMTKSYQAAENYSRKHGIRIYNATRGGNLEVFERVDFDSLFEVDDKVGKFTKGKDANYLVKK